MSATIPFFFAKKIERGQGRRKTQFFDRGNIFVCFSPRPQYQPLAQHDT